jgi:diguanylate cyclase (GGDEF)-like protein
MVGGKGRRTRRLISAEFRDRALEKRFRLENFGQDSRYAVLAMLAVSAIYGMSLVFELVELYSTAVLAIVVAARLSIIAATGVSTFLLYKWRNPLVLDWVIFTFTLLFSVSAAVILGVQVHSGHRPDGVTVPMTVFVLATMAVYVIAPVRLAFQIAAAAGFATTFVLLVVYTPLHPEIAIPVIAILFMAANLLGVVSTFRINDSRRLQWLNLEQERDLGNRLQAEITEREKLEQRLREQAVTDPLTGVYNRRHLFAHGSELFAQARRYNRPTAAILFDVDHFKRINDTYGHVAGDEVLKSITGSVGGVLRKPDVLARYGGEEFAILLPETDMTGAANLAERIRQVVESLTVKIEGRPEHVTVSIGFAVAQERDKDFEALVMRADDALYTAKDRGRNMVVGAV